MIPVVAPDQVAEAGAVHRRMEALSQAAGVYGWPVVGYAKTRSSAPLQPMKRLDAGGRRLTYAFGASSSQLLRHAIGEGRDCGSTIASRKSDRAGHGRADDCFRDDRITRVDHDRLLLIHERARQRRAEAGDCYRVTGIVAAPEPVHPPLRDGAGMASTR